MKKIVISIVLITSIVATPLSSYAGNPLEAPLVSSESEVFFNRKMPELHGKFMEKAVLVNDVWVLLASVTDEKGRQKSILYTYDTELTEVFPVFPGIYQDDVFVITDIGEYFDKLTITAVRYKAYNLEKPVGYHFFFPNEDFSYLWELSIPDNWVINDVFYGGKSLMFVVKKMGTSGTFVYNYFWPDEIFLVANFSQYESFNMIPSNDDEWLIQACTDQVTNPQIGFSACDWYRYSSNKTLAPLSGLPSGFVPFVGFPHTSGIDFVLTGMFGADLFATYTVRPGFEAGQVTVIEETQFDFSEGDVVDLTGQIKLSKDSHGRQFIIQGGNAFLLLDNDRDKDGIADSIESLYGTDPENIDSDSDGYDDFTELAHGYNPNGPCQIRSFEGPSFRYDRGFVPQEQHECFNRYLRNELADRLGNDWKFKYDVSDEREADITFAFIYGEYPIADLIRAIVTNSSIDTQDVYTTTR